MDFLESITLNCSTEAERELLRVALSNDSESGGVENHSKFCLESSATESLVGREFSDGQWVLHPLCQVSFIVVMRARHSKSACTISIHYFFQDLLVNVLVRFPQGVLAKLRSKCAAATADGGDDDVLSSVSIGIEFTGTLKSGVR